MQVLRVFYGCLFRRLSQAINTLTYFEILTMFYLLHSKLFVVVSKHSTSCKRGSHTTELSTWEVRLGNKLEKFLVFLESCPDEKETCAAPKSSSPQDVQLDGLYKLCALYTHPLSYQYCMRVESTFELFYTFVYTRP